MQSLFSSNARPHTRSVYTCLTIDRTRVGVFRRLPPYLCRAPTSSAAFRRLRYRHERSHQFSLFVSHRIDLTQAAPRSARPTTAERCRFSGFRSPHNCTLVQYPRLLRKDFIIIRRTPFAVKGCAMEPNETPGTVFTGLHGRDSNRFRRETQ